MTDVNTRAAQQAGWDPYKAAAQQAASKEEAEQARDAPRGNAVRGAARGAIPVGHGRRHRGRDWPGEMGDSTSSGAAGTASRNSIGRGRLSGEIRGRRQALCGCDDGQGACRRIRALRHMG